MNRKKRILFDLILETMDNLKPYSIINKCPANYKSLEINRMDHG
jgi:hypothetical protein